MHVVSDTSKIYAQVDGHEAVVAQVKTASSADTAPTYQELERLGYTQITQQWFDADWQRDVFVLVKGE